MMRTTGDVAYRSGVLMVLLAAAGLVAAGCASAPAAKGPPPVPFEQKMAWVLQLEDQRILRVPPPPPEPPAPGRSRRRAAPAPPPVLPDLTKLLTDVEPRVRRRAALAVGRVGLPEGVAALTATLKDADPEVRQMAAFAMGLIGDVSAIEPLTAALADPVPLVRGRAAEGIGLVALASDAALAAAKPAAPVIGQLAAEYAKTAAVTSMQPDGEMSTAPEAEAFKLALFALVRLRAYEPLAAAVLDGAGRPVVSWWPVAYALQRVDDKRAVGALRALLLVPGRYTAAFAARGLGQQKDTASVEALLKLAEGANTPAEVVVSVARALAAIGDPRAAARLAQLAGDPAVQPNVRLEAVSALGALRHADGLSVAQDLVTDDWPALRAAALGAVASIDQDSFVLVLSGLDPDRDWRVRAAVAEILGTLPAALASERLHAMLQDEDKRVVPSVLSALVKIKAEDANTIVMGAIKEADFVVRTHAARLIGEQKLPGGPDALREAYKKGQSDSAYSARAAALVALAEYGAAEASDTLKAALADKDWAVRVRAAELLAKIEPGFDAAHAIRPVPAAAVVPYTDPDLIAPAYSPRVFIETAKGTIEFELAVLDAPQTARNFMALAGKGFFNGLPIHRVVPNFVVQDGDSRGDGQGGPGYTIRDELNDRAYVRGTVGMALAWRDTGGSQFFITHSPQPHLEGRYTVFGRVVNGMDVVDRIQQGDVIDRVRVWDGTTMR